MNNTFSQNNQRYKADAKLIDEILYIARSCWRNMPKVEVYNTSSLEYLGVNSLQLKEKINQVYNLDLTSSNIQRCNTVIDVANLVAIQKNFSSNSSNSEPNRTNSKKSNTSDTNMHNTLNSKEKIEKAYKDFSSILDTTKAAISSLKTINPNFKSHQEEYKKQLGLQISKIESSLSDMQRYAIWDKLVIAFIGVTNAGKSTIIETFRILFDEPERRKALLKCPSGVDGDIIGDGRADFTRTYKEYNMSIGGRNFVLIDVPGIEGNEGVVKTEILKALGKAHCVFYVQGEGKKPDSATVEKIKGYLKDWVKVYSIYNVKGTSFNYDEEDERAVFKTRDIAKVEQEISRTMSGTLGNNYAGNITIQARLALCAYAKFARKQTELIGEQKDLLQSFGTAKAIFDFSNFTEITQKVDHLSSHFSDEILEAQRKKLFKLHVEAYKDLQSVNQSRIDEINRIIKKFQNCRNNVNGYFTSAKSSIKSQFRQELITMFDTLEKDGCAFIDSGKEGDELTNLISADQRRLTQKVESNFDVIIKSESDDLAKKIKNEIQRLKESIAVSSVSGNFSTSFNMDLSKVVGELEFGFSDFFNISFALGSAFYAGWLIAAGANWWNPVGWGLSAIGALIAIFGDSKKDKAKKQLRKKIAESKDAFFNNKWYSITNVINRQLSSKSFDDRFKEIIRDFNTLKQQMDSVMSDIKRNSSKFK